MRYVFPVVFCVFAGFAAARADDNPDLKALRERIERLEKQNQQLEERDKARREAEEKAKREADEKKKQDEEKKKADEAQKKADEEKKKAEAEAKGYEIGTDTGLKGSWENGLWFTSAERDFRLHIGGRFNFDGVWWKEPQFLKGPPPGPGGIPASKPGDGVGNLEDGLFFRRVRFRADGTAYEFFEFVVEVDFENVNTVAFDNLWVGMKGLPFIDTIRAGHLKVPQGLEMVANDYYITFIERSALSDAFWHLYAPGVEIAETYLDQRITTQTMVGRINPNPPYNGSAFGEGEYMCTTRMTGLPVFEGDGRYLVHLGASYQWRRGNRGIDVGPTGNSYADTQSVIRFRDRPELRDAIGVSGQNSRFIDTGWLMGDHVHTFGPEFMTIWGPFSLLAESAFAVGQNVRQIFPAADFNADRGNPMFWGAYVQLGYFLTGENRGYDKRFGTYDRPRVNENFFCVRDCNRCFHCGTGAIELVYRYSFVDLNANGINGGTMAENTVGFNWYLNDNCRLQMNYVNVNRIVASPANSGTTNGLGAMLAWYF